MKKKNKTHEICSTSLDYQRIDFEAKRWVFEQRFDSFRIPMGGLQWRSFMDHAAQNMVLQLQATVASRKFDVKTVRFPSGPWQFVKFNLIGSSLYGLAAIRWFIDKFPVKYVEVTMEANAYNPTIAIPDHETFVSIYVKSNETISD